MTIDQVRQTLRKIGLKPQQAAGQNFLLDEQVVEDMVDVAGIEAGDRVLEIGPGLGILTQALLERGAEVVAVELDQRLAEYTQKHFAEFPGLQVIHQDIFKLNLGEYFEDGQYKLVSNLPYSATSLIFRNFLSLPPRPNSLTVMVQQDVAERITAQPGALSVLAVMVQWYAQVDVVRNVPSSSFYPVPKVESSVVHVHDLKSVQLNDAQLFKTVRAGFSARRKQLQNSLAATFHTPPSEVAKKLEKIGVSPTSRAQEIPVQTWPKISQVLT